MYHVFWDRIIFLFIILIFRHLWIWYSIVVTLDSGLLPLSMIDLNLNDVFMSTKCYFLLSKFIHVHCDRTVFLVSIYWDWRFFIFVWFLTGVYSSVGLHSISSKVRLYICLCVTYVKSVWCHLKSSGFRCHVFWGPPVFVVVVTWDYVFGFMSLTAR